LLALLSELALTQPEDLSIEMKSQHNALTPLYRLPMELLELVLEQLYLLVPDDRRRPDIFHNFDDKFYCFRQILECVKVNLVCRRLREATLNTPRLWTLLTASDRPPWRALKLTRAAGYAPELRCELNKAAKSNPSRIFLTKKLIGRSHAVSFVLTNSLEYNAALLDILKTPAPHLTVLSLDVANADGDVIQDGIRHLEHICTQVVELSLSFVIFTVPTAWPTHIWPRLTLLRLDEVGAGAAFLMKMLHRMPRLKTLSLRDLCKKTFWAHEDWKIESMKTVPLEPDHDSAGPHGSFLGELEQLHIKDSPVMITPMLLSLERAIP
jgi:hypothetical protein